MAHPDYKKSEQKAAELLKKYSITEPIVNVFDIVKNEGLDLKFIKFPPKLQEVAGFFDPDTKTIFVNAEEPTNRQTFTVAHELGHYLLEHKPTEYKVLMRWEKPEGEKQPLEQEANCFAACLLVPENILKDTMKKYDLGKHDLDVRILAQMFGVSREMMKYRLMKI